MKKLSLLIMASLITVTSYAQQNSVKLGILSFVFRTVNIEYERVTTGNQSIAIEGGIMIPWSNPLGLGTDVDGFQEDDLRMTRVSFTPQYRFYTGGDAMQGFYVAPYLRFNRFAISSDYSDVITSLDGTQTEEVDAVARLFLNTIGVGFQLGSQWLINDQVTIDWYFLGLSVNRNVFGLSLDYDTDLQLIDPSDLEQDLSDEYGETFLGEDRISVDADATSASIRAPFLFPGLRTGLSIGYAF